MGIEYVTIEHRYRSTVLKTNDGRILTRLPANLPKRYLIAAMCSAYQRLRSERVRKFAKKFDRFDGFTEKHKTPYW